MSLALFFALYCLEAGIFFTVVPWTRVWTLNPILHNNLLLGAWFDNPFLRGAISGFGLAHLLIGVRDIVRINREARLRREAGDV